MSDKPDALLLADALQRGADDPMWAHHCEISKVTCESAAAELRLLHSTNEQLRNQNTELDAACAKLEVEVSELHERHSRDIKLLGAGLYKYRALNAELVAALRDLEWAASGVEYMESEYANELSKARAALAKTQGEINGQD